MKADLREAKVYTQMSLDRVVKIGDNNDEIKVVNLE